MCRGSVVELVIKFKYIHWLKLGKICIASQLVTSADVHGVDNYCLYLFIYLYIYIYIYIYIQVG